MDTYEKKYNEALKWMRELYPGLHGATKEDAEHYFPELRESEDEKIRRTLVEYFGPKAQLDFVRGVPIQKIRDWLEKQKDHFRDDTKKVEKQDYSSLNDLERAIHRGFLSAGVENVSVTIIKETAKECLEQVKPAEWSEEDADILNCCISSIEEAKENRYAYKETDGDTSYDHEIAWLKSLRPVSKESLQPQQNMSIGFMLYLDEHRPEGKMSLSNAECEDIDKAFKENDWAKIVRYYEKYRPHWKPSEEQMKALERTTRLANFALEEDRRKALVSLHEHLKNL